mmetsp:Transcript_55438/g.134613  ORF Transcript_55438/g.134613 Transcript_55438/m.134613 type:complete len:138 (-) Transcript_55438:1125-1538(-)
MSVEEASHPLSEFDLIGFHFLTSTVCCYNRILSVSSYSIDGFVFFVFGSVLIFQQKRNHTFISSRTMSQLRSSPNSDNSFLILVTSNPDDNGEYAIASLFILNKTVDPSGANSSDVSIRAMLSPLFDKILQTLWTIP